MEGSGSFLVTSPFDDVAKFRDFGLVHDRNPIVAEFDGSVLPASSTSHISKAEPARFA